MTTTTTTPHRPGCTQPGWTLTPSRTVAALSWARCAGCGAVEVRMDKETNR